MTWSQLDKDAGGMGTMPSARTGHSMTSVGHDIYLFGGYGGECGEMIERAKEGEVERLYWDCVMVGPDLVVWYSGAWYLIL